MHRVSLISFRGMTCSSPLEWNHYIGMLIYIHSLCRSLSTGRDSLFMGKHFRYRVYTGGRLSFGAERLKKADLWLV